MNSRQEMLSIHRFVALDFETADHRPDSACAIGVARVEDGVIVATESTLVRPPRQKVHFTGLHGLSWTTLRHAPSFGAAWPKVSSLFQDVEAIVAHNATFDRTVMLTCCAAWSLRPPRAAFVCTRLCGESVLNVAKPSLGELCAGLNVVNRQPHDALSDATAAAHVFLALQQRAKASK
jgi:DNA polymerase-3 subunit epsilon